MDCSDGGQTTIAIYCTVAVSVAMEMVHFHRHWQKQCAMLEEAIIVAINSPYCYPSVLRVPGIMKSPTGTYISFHSDHTLTLVVKSCRKHIVEALAI